MELTRDDVTVLCEALEAWERKDAAGEIFGAIVGTMIAKDDPVARAKFEAESKARAELSKRAEQIRKERSVILRAKLLQMSSAAGLQSIERAVNDHAAQDA